MRVYSHVRMCAARLGMRLAVRNHSVIFSLENIELFSVLLSCGI